MSHRPGEVAHDQPQILEGLPVRASRIYIHDHTVTENGDTGDVQVRGSSLVQGLRASTLFGDMQASGRAYSSAVTAPALADDAALDMLVVIPLSVVVSMTLAIQTVGDVQIQVYEHSTPVGNGTPNLITNLNRLFAATRPPKSSAFSAPNFTTGDIGTLIFDTYQAGGAKNPLVSPVAGDLGDAVLLSGVKYLMRLTNRSGQAALANLTATGIERPLSVLNDEQAEAADAARAVYGL